MIVHYFFLDYKKNLQNWCVLVVCLQHEWENKKFIAEEAARAIRLVFFFHCYSYFFMYLNMKYVN